MEYFHGDIETICKVCTTNDNKKNQVIDFLEAKSKKGSGVGKTMSGVPIKYKSTAVDASDYISALSAA